MPPLIWICLAVWVTHFCGIRNCCLRVKSAALVDVTLSHGGLATWERLFWSSQWLLWNVLPRSTFDITAFAESNTRQATIQRRVKQHPTLINPLPVRQQVCIGEKQGRVYTLLPVFYRQYLVAARSQAVCISSRLASEDSVVSRSGGEDVLEMRTYSKDTWRSKEYVWLFASWHERSSCWSCRVSPRHCSLLVHRYEYEWTAGEHLQLARTTTSSLT